MTLFNLNHASVAGGAVYYVRSNQNETLEIIQTELTNNSASYGGALYISDHNLNKPELLHNLFYGNNAEDFGKNIVEPPRSLAISVN